MRPGGSERPIELEVSRRRYNGRVHSTIKLLRPGFTAEIGALVREARLLAGWTQSELADRAITSQAMISRIERRSEASVDLAVIERVLAALGLQATLDVRGRHLDDRRRQLDALHGVGSGFVGRRLTRLGWRTVDEAEVGEESPRGWIDVLGFRDADQSLLAEETKTELDDVGSLIRQVTFYERLAWTSARRLGWHARRTVVMVALLDTERVAERVIANRDLLRNAFPGSVPDLDAWLRDPGRTAPAGRTLVTFDPRHRGRSWMRSSHLGDRRSAPAFIDYADAARQLLRPALARRPR